MDIESDTTGGKVLIMDDDEIIRLLLTKMLTGFGYEVETTSDGIKAIDAYQKAMKQGKIFNAVILDITVTGGMGGVETIKRLLEINPDIRAIVSSGYATDPVMSEYKQYGFKAVVNKPYRVNQMKEILQALLLNNTQ